MTSKTPPPLQFVKNSIPTVTITSPTSPSLKSPRTARFAEATAIVSPIEPNTSSDPFKDNAPRLNHYLPQPQVSDIGFGYLNGGVKAGHESVEMEETDERYLPPATPKGPLKSALKSPGAPPRNLDAMLSPTFSIMSPTQFEEDALEKAEKQTTKIQKRDLRQKIRVRWAKIFMRGINFSCSLIVLSMISTTFSIFNSTKSIPSRNNLPPWAFGTNPWPQILLLCIACVSLTISIFVIVTGCRRGYRRAEKVGMYYTTFSVAIFIFSIVMWIVGAVVLNQSKVNGNGNDIWGWSCKQNRRQQLFQADISYSLVCRLQNWSLMCCIIEVVIELFTLLIYGVTFYRYYTKRKLRKTMAARDRARSDLYLAQLRAQSAPNTPGFPLSPGILSPRDGGWVPPQGFETYNTDKKSKKAAEAGFTIEEEGVQYATVPAKKPQSPTTFTLQAPPLAKKKNANAGLDSMPTSPASITATQTSLMSAAMDERRRSHVPAAPGEIQYGSVAIPGAYAPMTPTAPQAPQTPANVAAVTGFNFHAQ